MIDNIAYDMIENLEASKMVDFLRMMDDYKAQLYMEYINKEYNQSSGFVSDVEDDLPF
jgi:phosphopantetheine adenylyltransferase